MTSADPVSGVPAQTLREIFEHSGLTLGETARRLGWVRPDVQRVRRRLGLAPYAPGRQPVEDVSYDRAVEICEALDVEPWEVGL